MTPLTAERVRYIRACLDAGDTQKRIAEQMGLSKSYISRLKTEHLGKGYMPPPKVDTLTKRWTEVHDIGGIGARAVKETA